MHWLKRADLAIILIRSVLCVCGVLSFSKLPAQESSVLGSGKWFKLAITQTGIHKIDMALLKSMGIDAGSLKPSQIQVYGNGGQMLPQKNSASRPDGLIQNAILVTGEEDGKFDATDEVYFYAEGPQTVNYDSARSSLRHQTNLYSDSSFYFFTIGNSNGLRVKKMPATIVPRGKTMNEFIDYWFHEKESVNVLRSGRTWWGEYLGGAALSFQADIPGIVPSSQIRFLGSAMGAAQTTTRFTWQLNGQVIGESQVGTVGGSTYDIKGQISEIALNISAGTAPASRLSIGVGYNKNGQSSALAYLNDVGLQVRRELRVYDKQQVYYFLPGDQDTVTYQVKNTPPDWQFWNITDQYNPVSLPVNQSDGVFFTGKDGKTMRRYIGFEPTQAYIPIAWQGVPNQNIINNSAPDLLIVTPPLWENEAKRLGAYRKEKDGLDVLVVTTTQVYNACASGIPDPTAIRDFVRRLYQKIPGKLKYLLLFGDAVYDYKNNLKNQSLAQRNSWVPVYESRESLNPVYTYSSDDYYGFMKDEDGDWPESFTGDHFMDIGVGRLPVKSPSEARHVVDKLIRYEASRLAMGSWRNQINFVADDGDGNVHQDHADQLAKLVNNDFLPARLFLDAYPQTTTSEGQKVPAINSAIQKSIDRGTLVLNYTGHGGVSGWAEEQVLTLADMLSAGGYDNPPLLLTATCDFGRYDDPGLVSGAELMVLSPKGAAIGAVSTTRPVYSSTNFTLSKAFYEALVKAGPKTRMGDLFRDTKNNALVGALNRNFTLLGDPSMKLAKAEKRTRWTQKPDTLRAVENVSLKIEIYDIDSGITDTSFEGTAHITVYDKQSVFKTLGSEADPANYSEFAIRLFDGVVTVHNGQIACDFVMPKDIDYRTGPGRVSVYAVRSDSLSDAGGQLGILVGGSGQLAVDNIPPTVRAYLNDPSFKSGDKVNASSVLIVKLTDEHGINLSRTGIGHDITLTLNDTLLTVLNDYYTADLDNFKSGTIVYPFENLPSGNYTIRIKVWDTYTNFSEIAFGFQVVGATGIEFKKLSIYPNPFINELSFELNHNRPNEDLEITFHLSLNSGQRLGTSRWQYYNSESVIRESITSTRLVQLLMPHISYLYTIEIKSLKDNSVAKRSGRIIRSP